MNRPAATRTLTLPRTSGGGDEAAPSRRAFLLDAVRLPLATALTAGSALLVLRPRGSAETDCVRPLLCGDCAKFAGCGLPKAEQARREGAVDV